LAGENEIIIRYSGSDNGAAAAAGAIRTAIEQLERATAQAGGTFGSTGNQGAQLAQHLASIGQSAQQSTQHVGGFFHAFDAIGDYIQQVVHLSAVWGGARLVLSELSNLTGGVKSSLIGFNEQLQQATIGFTQMLGSGQKADAFLRQLSDFANATPFRFNDLVQAAQRMLAFGFTAQQVKPLLEAVGNTAASMGAGDEGINRLTLALGQMQAKGKVSGDELLQLQEAGIKTNDVFAIIAQQSGKTADEIAAMASKGKLASSDFITAFEIYTQRFQGQMEAQSHSFSGAMSTIQDSLQSAGARAFKPFFDLITEGAVKVATFLQSERFSSFVDTVGTLMDNLGVSIRNVFKTFQEFTPAEALDQLKEKFHDTLDEILHYGQNGDADAAGQNFIVSFAEGMVKGANGVLSTVVNQIAQMIADFFIGQSPPPKGPLSDIGDGGKQLAETYTHGMVQGFEAGIKPAAAVVSDSIDTATKSTQELAAAARQAAEEAKLLAAANKDVARAVEQASDVALTLKGQLNAAADPGQWNAVAQSLYSGATSMVQLSEAAATVGQHVEQLGFQISTLSDTQASMKQTIADISNSYEDQIDPLQRQLDIMQQQVDWEGRKRDLALQYSDVLIQQMENGDQQLSGLQDKLKGLQQQQSDENAPRMADRRTENTIRELQRQMNNLVFTPRALPQAPVAPVQPQAPILPPGQQLSTEQAAALAQQQYQYQLQRQAYEQQKQHYDEQVKQINDENTKRQKQIEDQKKAIQEHIAQIQEQQRKQQEADEDHRKALEIQIYNVQKQVEARKQYFEKQLESNKKQEEANALEEKRKSILQQINALPIQKQIADLKTAEDRVLEPLQHAATLNQRRIDSLQTERGHWQLLATDIDAILKPLQAADQAMQQLAAKQEAAARAADKTAAGGIPKSVLPANVKLKEEDIGGAAKEAVKLPDFEKLGENMGKSVTAGFTSYVRAHFGGLVIGAIGASIGEAVLGPVGLIAGGLFGAHFGDGIQKKLDALPWGKIFGTIEPKIQAIGHAFEVFIGVLDGSWGPSITKVVENMGGLDGKAATVADTIRNTLIPEARRFGEWVLNDGIPAVRGFVAAIIPHVVDAVKGISDWVIQTGLPALRGLGAWLLTEGLPAFKNVADFITKDVVPAFNGIALWITSQGLPVLRQLWNFFTTNILPVYKQFVGFVEAEVMPVLNRFWGFIGENILPVLTEWWSFLFTKILPILESWWKLILNTLVPALTTLWNFIDKNILPVLNKVGGYINETLLPAMRTIATFIEQTFVQAFTSLYNFVNEKALPKLQELGTYLAVTLKPAYDVMKIAIDVLLVAFTDFYNYIDKNWDGLTAKLSGPFNAVKGVFQDFIHILGVGVENVGDFFDIENLRKAGQGMQNLFPDAVKNPVGPGGGIAKAQATGNMNFPGGSAIIGEAGRELFHRGGGWELADRPTMLELPKGATVLPNAVTEMLLKMGVPGFAGGLLGQAAGAAGNVAGDALDLVRRGAQAVFDKITSGLNLNLDLPGALKDMGKAVGSAAKDGLMDLVKGLIPNVRGLITDAITGLTRGPFGNVTPGSGVWHNPVPGYRAVQGSWTHGGTHDREAAVDWATPLGTSILAPDGGFAGTVWNGDGATGRTGIIDHGNGWITYYGHVRDFAFGAVRQDMAVGHTGSPEEDGGAGSGAHLHFAMRLHGAYERPEDYIPGIFGLATGGITQDEGVYHLHPREAVIPLDSPRGRDLAGGGGDIIFQPGAIVVQGTVVTERDLVDAVHTGLLRKKNEGQRLNLS
jgi:tape measure domain-containing protein